MLNRVLRILMFVVQATLTATLGPKENHRSVRLWMPTRVFSLKEYLDGIRPAKISACARCRLRA
jgi:hypothetical protein